VGRQATRFVWEMDLRTMCLEISPRQVQSLILPNPIIDGELVNRMLLDQFELRNLPDLSRYGVDYSGYLKVFDPGILDRIQPPGKQELPAGR
jgi:hypothetical protein